MLLFTLLSSTPVSAGIYAEIDVEENHSANMSEALHEESSMSASDPEGDSSSKDASEENVEEIHAVYSEMDSKISQNNPQNR